MPIVDPFDTPTAAAAPRGIVDPFAADSGATADKPLNWSDVPLEAAKNIPSSAYNVVKGLASIPVGVVKSALPYATQGPFGAPAAMVTDAANAIYNDPGMLKRFGQSAWNGLINRYGSEEAIKKTIATDPVGFALDASMLYGGVENLASKVARGAGDVAKAADVSKPFYDIPRQPEAPPPIPRVPTAVEQAQQGLQQAGTPVNIPRGLTLTNPVMRAGSVALSKAPVIGAPLDEAIRAVPEQMGAGIEAVAGVHSPPMPENIVGGGIERSLSGAAEREAAAAKAAAEAEHEAQTAKWEAETRAREQAITDRQAQATNAATRAFGDVAPMEMAQDTIGDVQGAHRQSAANITQKYDVVNSLDARVHNDAFTGLRDRAEKALADEGYTIDDPSSHGASMLRELDRLSGVPGEPPPNVPKRVQQALEKEYGQNVPAAAYEAVGFPGGVDAVAPDFRLAGRHAPAPGANAISVQGMEQISKRLNGIRMKAANPEEGAVAKIIKGSYEDFRNDALDTHLTPDSAPGSREAIDAARAAYSDHKNRFGYNYKRLPEGEPRNAAKTLNQIVTGGIGPEGLRDNLIGAKPGNRRVSAPLYEAIANAVPNAGEFRNRMRGAYWNAVTEGGPNAIARNVDGLTPTRMGSHLFEPHEHDLMRGYSQLSQRTPELMKESARLAKQSEPKLAKVESGKAEQLANQMLGRNRSEENVLSALDNAARGGDIKMFARTWGRMSDANRNEFRGSVLRGLGGGGETFSVDKFISNWDKYSDQAKAVMFDREHRQTIQNVYTLAKQYSENLKRYGNPSGTAQVSAWHKLLAGTAKTALAVGAGTMSVAHPLGMVAAGLGGRRIATLLARPEGAKQLVRWSKMAQLYNSAPSAAKLIALQNATRALASSAGSMLGAKTQGVSPLDFIRQLQGPVPAGAQNEQR